MALSAVLVSTTPERLAEVATAIASEPWAEVHHKDALGRLIAVVDSPGTDEAAERLKALYGIDVDSPDLEILMRHRAVLFGILGAFFAYAAFVPALQPIAFVAAAASLATFFYLAVAVGNYGAPIRKIVVGDVVAVICLAAAVLLYASKNAGQSG